MIPPNPGQTNYGRGKNAEGFGDTGNDGVMNALAELLDYGVNLAQCVIQSLSK